jgi:FAD synthetase
LKDMASECAAMASRYIGALAEALRGIGRRGVAPRVRPILEQAEDYLRDSRFYLERGEGAVALASVAYAEGLLDALRLLGLVDFDWPRPKPGAGRGQAY